MLRSRVARGGVVNPAEAAGTTVRGTIQRCDKGLKPCEPELPAIKPAFIVALSGGGLRATLSAVGVLRFLADAELLDRVTIVSSVSGGSIASGLLAHAYPELEAAAFSTESFVRNVERVAVRTITSRSMTYAMARNLWRLLDLKTTTTDIFTNVLDRWYFCDQKLTSLPERCRFIFNATNLTTGQRFGFEREVLGDEVFGYVESGDTRLALAIACSASVPGFYPAHTIDRSFPCDKGLKTGLVDGGVYDNTATKAVEDLAQEHPDDYCVVALNAGGVFRVKQYGYVLLLRDLLRSESVLYNVETTDRMQDLLRRLIEFETTGKGVRGVQFALGMSLDGSKRTTAQRAGYDEWCRDARPEQSPELVKHLSNLSTSLSRFSLGDARQLVYRGWWLTGASLSTFHRALLPSTLPRWVART